MRPGMGTLVHVSASGRDAVALGHAVDAAFAAVEQVDRLMSFHDPASDLARINGLAAQAPQVVHPLTWAVLRRALRFAAASDGLFDISVAPLLVRDGLLPGAVENLPDAGCWRHVALLPGSRVFLDRRMLIDLGGIAKGFAVDRAIRALKVGGCQAGVVNAGGDWRCFGPAHRPVHLRRRGGLVQVAQLRTGAVATSAPHVRQAGRLAQPLGGIFDPRTRGAWKGGGAVMVAAPTCIVADALTKVAALAGPGCERLLDRFGARPFWDADPDAVTMA